MAPQSDSPSVSVCIPTYNGAKYLQACLESALNQTLDDIEIVVVDDASTDDTVAIVEHFIASDHRVRLFHNEANLGLVQNWNQSIKNARGSWIKPLFQDDTLDPGCVETLLKHAIDERSLVSCCFRRFIFEADFLKSSEQMYLGNREFVSSQFQHGVLRPEEIATLAMDQLGSNFFGEPIVALIHRSVFDKVGYFDDALAQRCDTEFWVRAGVNFGLSMVREDLATYRVHGSTTSAQNYARRQFADEWLDQVVILHHFLFDPVYEPLRIIAKQSSEFRNLVNRFWDSCHYARSIVQEASCPEGVAKKNDWERVANIYPRIADVSIDKTISRWVRHLGRA